MQPQPLLGTCAKCGAAIHNFNNFGGGTIGCYPMCLGCVRKAFNQDLQAQAQTQAQEGQEASQG